MDWLVSLFVGGVGGLEVALETEAEAEAGVEGRGGGVVAEEEVEVGAGFVCVPRVAIFSASSATLAGGKSS